MSDIIDIKYLILNKKTAIKLAEITETEKKLCQHNRHCAVTIQEKYFTQHI